MLKIKPFRALTGFESERRVIPEDEEILICLKCPLPECKNTYQCKRFKEERLRIRRERSGKNGTKRNKKSFI
jgi:hypothetical protein